jgi:branched-chain amino acid transport system ATP-binding protein
MSLLEVAGLRSGYGRLPVVRGVDLRVNAGEVVTLIGPNGAGKTTVLRSIMGEARITGGTITVDGVSVIRVNPARLRRLGVGYAPQGRHLFPKLSVLDNLQLGCFAMPRDNRQEVMAEQLERVLQLFPAVKAFLHRPARTLSGGQQQMVALGRALMSKPRLLLLDEPSMGLAPEPLAMIFGAIRDLRSEGVAALLVEQVASTSLNVAQRAYIMHSGHIADEGNAVELLRDANRLRASYFAKTLT